MLVEMKRTTVSLKYKAAVALEEMRHKRGKRKRGISDVTGRGRASVIQYTAIITATPAACDYDGVTSDAMECDWITHKREN